jgi:hypothetical protein
MLSSEMEEGDEEVEDSEAAGGLLSDEQQHDGEAEAVSGLLRSDEQEEDHDAYSSDGEAGSSLGCSSEGASPEKQLQEGVGRGQPDSGTGSLFATPRKQQQQAVFIPLEVVCDFLAAAFDGMGGVVDSIVDAAELDEVVG